MRSLRFTLVDVFTDRAFTGNGLCVFDDGSSLSASEMQAIAREMNQAETTFLLPVTNSEATYRMRIFTPGAELPFAGHPTIGTAAVLGRAGRVPAGRLLQETASGLTEVNVQPDLITFVAPTPSFIGAPDAERLSRALRMAVTTPEILQSGIRHLLVEAPSPGALSEANPDANGLAELAREWEYIGVVLVSLTPGAASLARVRMFAPGTGIPEDPATGSAAALLALYLHRRGRLPASGFWYEQGVEMGRPSRLWVDTKAQPEGHLRVEVGGQAVEVGRGELALP